MYRRHPATRVPSRNRRRRAHPLPRRRHPTPRGSSRTAKSSTDRDSAASPLRRGSATSRNTTVGKSANALNSQRAKRASRRLSRGSTRDVYRPRAQAHQREAAIDCARVPIVTSADVLPPTPERDHWMLEVVVEAVAVPATVLDALANAELSVRDISPQGQTRVVEAVA